MMTCFQAYNGEHELLFAGVPSRMFLPRRYRLSSRGVNDAHTPTSFMCDQYTVGTLSLVAAIPVGSRQPCLVCKRTGAPAWKLTGVVEPIEWRTSRHLVVGQVLLLTEQLLAVKKGMLTRKCSTLERGYTKRGLSLHCKGIGRKSAAQCNQNSLQHWHEL